MLLKPSTAPKRKVKAIQFGVLSPELMKEYSVMQAMNKDNAPVLAGVTRSEAYGPNGEDIYGGICDPRMGDLWDLDNPGYFGHLELHKPVYHVGFLGAVVTILRCISHHTSTPLKDIKDPAILKLQESGGSPRSPKRATASKSAPRPADRSPTTKKRDSASR